MNDSAYGKLVARLGESGALGVGWRGAFLRTPRSPFVPERIWIEDGPGGYRPITRQDSPEEWWAKVHADDVVVTQLRRRGRQRPRRRDEFREYADPRRPHDGGIGPPAHPFRTGDRVRVVDRTALRTGRTGSRRIRRDRRGSGRAGRKRAGVGSTTALCSSRATELRDSPGRRRTTE